MTEPNLEQTVSKEGELAATGERAATIGKAAHAIPAMLAAPFAAMDGVVNGMFPSWIRTGLSKIGVVSPTLTDKLTSFTGVTGLAAIPAAVVFAGSGFKAVDAISHGEKMKAANLTIRGATEAAVVVMDSLTLGLGEIASLVMTGKFLATNVGDFAEKGLVAAESYFGAAPTTKLTSARSYDGHMQPAQTVTRTTAIPTTHAARIEAKRSDPQATTTLN